jgi:hypothetical protein
MTPPTPVTADAVPLAIPPVDTVPPELSAPPLLFAPPVNDFTCVPPPLPCVVLLTVMLPPLAVLVLGLLVLEQARAHDAETNSGITHFEPGGGRSFIGSIIEPINAGHRKPKRFSAAQTK